MLLIMPNTVIDNCCECYRYLESTQGKQKLPMFCTDGISEMLQEESIVAFTGSATSHTDIPNGQWFKT